MWFVVCSCSFSERLQPLRLQVASIDRSIAAALADPIGAALRRTTHPYIHVRVPCRVCPRSAHDGAVRIDININIPLYQYTSTPLSLPKVTGLSSNTLRVLWVIAIYFLFFCR